MARAGSRRSTGSSSSRGRLLLVGLPLLAAAGAAVAVVALNPCGLTLVSSERELPGGGRALVCGDDPAAQRQLVFDESGELIEDSKLSAGKRHGPFLRYNPSTGEIAEMGAYAEGELDGVYTTLHDNGRTASTTSYVRGKREGPYVAFHPNGLTKTRGAFKNDTVTGEWSSFSADGVPLDGHDVPSARRDANPIGADVVFAGRTLTWWNQALAQAGDARRRSLLKSAANAGLEPDGEGGLRVSAAVVSGFERRKEMP